MSVLELAIRPLHSERGKFLITDRQITELPVGGLRAFEVAALEFAREHNYQIRTEETADGLLFLWRKINRVSQPETPTDNA